MLMPTSDRKKIYEHLFADGVTIAKHDYNLKSHPEIEGVKNLYVIRALKVCVSLNSNFLPNITGSRSLLWMTMFE